MSQNIPSTYFSHNLNASHKQAIDTNMPNKRLAPTLCALKYYFGPLSN